MSHHIFLVLEIRVKIPQEGTAKFMVQSSGKYVYFTDSDELKTACRQEIRRPASIDLMFSVKNIRIYTGILVCLIHE